MNWRSVGNVVLVALYAYLAVAVGVNLVGSRVASWLVVGVIAVVSAAGALTWRDVVREWWAADISEPYKFAIVVALSLCYVPLVFATMLAREAIPYVVKLFALGLIGGYVIVFVCDRINIPKQLASLRAE